MQLLSKRGVDLLVADNFIARNGHCVARGVGGGSQDGVDFVLELVCRRDGPAVLFFWVEKLRENSWASGAEFAGIHASFHVGELLDGFLWWVREESVECVWIRRQKVG